VTSFLAVIISQQVREMKKSEKMALLSNQNTSKFITKMNYELRTPLNTIIGYSEMIHLGYFGALNEKQKERVYDIYICGTYLLEFVHDILDIIREEEGKLVLSEVKVKIAPIMETVFRTVLPYAKKEGVNIVCEEGIYTLPELKGDERKLRQSFLNLLTNMVKYTPSGGMVSLSGEIDAKGNMVINVISRGITISAEDFSLAFSMSGQLNSSDTEGGGLGLPLSKIFIERHGGQIKLHSADGESITVRVILPAERVL
jgi:signal transduction histidine kinase